MFQSNEEENEYYRNQLSNLSSYRDMAAGVMNQRYKRALQQYEQAFQQYYYSSSYGSGVAYTPVSTLVMTHQRRMAAIESCIEIPDQRKVWLKVLLNTKIGESYDYRQY